MFADVRAGRSTIGITVSQSALLIIRAGLLRTSKSRMHQLLLDLPKFAAIRSLLSSWRSWLLPLGSPIRPVPPPASAIECVPEALQPRQSHQRHGPDLQAVGGGIEADVGRHFAAGQDLGQPFGAVVYRPRH